MMYQCQACEYEEARGCLPGVTCGLYFVVLLSATAQIVLAGTWLLKQLLPTRPADAPPPEPMPWWVWFIVAPIGFVVMIAGAWLLDFLLGLTEYLVIRRKPCQHCGAKRWSRGYTRGFGL